MTRILVSSAGRRVALIASFRRAAEQLRQELQVVAVDAEPSWSPACQLADVAIRVPRCTHASFPSRILRICIEHGVDAIIPTIDTELPVYAEQQPLFRKHGTAVLVPSMPFVHLVRDKLATSKKLAEVGVPVPLTWSAATALSEAESLPYPLIVKPIDGSSSKGVSSVSDPNALRKTLASAPGLIVQQLCHGTEFTVNAFYDSGKCVCCVPHLRRFVRGGEVCFAETMRVPAFSQVADCIVRDFPDLYGPLCFQGFRDQNGQITVFEINARFGGGYPICDQAGGTFAKWILQKLAGQPPSYSDQWVEGLRMLRYDDAVFVPPNDTSQRC